ncbi:type II toxin-antitoxin system VapC family toxin [Mycobacterium branderi]|uniref:PIN domain-containing protein n=1 Tax=Mycobacterium branderi TaxID=43348 RepID=A0A7I7W0Q3_9MYCO|nr:type II toxin-antitoxin system VapC family toxin [Mycobacterium branderi]MCV7233220.1 type II toxin-antitoxin system VapC family toxin [Mycobacterium branderi]ORA41294.1 PIN domain-containing protein [Mycobacterium branderi]BBZ10335.1 ribonuclease VapC47 [Mycobacterium branderi]
MIYLDASALVTYVLERPNVAELRAFLAARPELCGATSTVGFVETVRNCDRAGDFPGLMTQLLRDYDELQLTSEIRDRAAVLPGGLKTLDAIHVATAETLGDELVAFVTYDRRLANVARSQGLPVVSP